jgi:hypothetical protein
MHLKRKALNPYVFRKTSDVFSTIMFGPSIDLVQ